jgi:hypothetical protein
LKAVRIPAPTCGTCEDGDFCCEEQILFKGVCNQEKLENLLDGSTEKHLEHRCLFPEFLTILLKSQILNS